MITDRLGGELTPEQIQELDAHLETCESCQQEAKETGDIWNLTAEALNLDHENEAEPTLKPEQYDAIFEAEKKLESKPRPKINFVIMEIAASVLIAIVVLAVFMTKKSDSSNQKIACPACESSVDEVNATPELEKDDVSDVAVFKKGVNITNAPLPKPQKSAEIKREMNFSDKLLADADAKDKEFVVGQESGGKGRIEENKASKQLQLPEACAARSVKADNTVKNKIKLPVLKLNESRTTVSGFQRKRSIKKLEKQQAEVVKELMEPQAPLDKVNPACKAPELVSREYKMNKKLFDKLGGNIEKIKKYLAEKGITFPANSLISYDQTRQLLKIKNTGDNLEKAKKIIDDLNLSQK
jgi:hypothetical protein